MKQIRMLFHFSDTLMCFWPRIVRCFLVAACKQYARRQQTAVKGRGSKSKTHCHRWYIFSYSHW